MSQRGWTGVAYSVVPFFWEFKAITCDAETGSDVQDELLT